MLMIVFRCGYGDESSVLKCGEKGKTNIEHQEVLEVVKVLCGHVSVHFIPSAATNTQLHS